MQLAYQWWRNISREASNQPLYLAGKPRQSSIRSNTMALMKKLKLHHTAEDWSSCQGSMNVTQQAYADRVREIYTRRLVNLTKKMLFLFQRQKCQTVDQNRSVGWPCLFSSVPKCGFHLQHLTLAERSGYRKHFEGATSFQPSCGLEANVWVCGVSGNTTDKISHHNGNHKNHQQ